MGSLEVAAAAAMAAAIAAALAAAIAAACRSIGAASDGHATAGTMIISGVPLLWPAAAGGSTGASIASVAGVARVGRSADARARENCGVRGSSPQARLS